MLRRLTGIVSFTIAMVSVAPAAGAQQVLGIGDDALTLPAGSVRLRVSGGWSWFNEQYDSNGVKHPLGERFSLDTVGVAQIPTLAPLQTALRSLTANNTLNVSLGKTFVSASGRAETATVGAEFGLTHWLQIGVTVPIVRTRANVFLTANPAGIEGNLGINPARTDQSAFNSDTAFAHQIVAAGIAVATYCAGSGAADSRCTNGAALASSAQSFGSGLALYESSTFVPTQGGTIQAAINSRAQSIVTQLNSFSDVGVPAVVATGVVGALTPLATPDLQQVLADSAFGIGIDSLRTIERLHLGDIEVAAKILLLDSFHGSTQARMQPQGVNGRFAIGVAYRFPTGDVATPGSLFDVPIGTHEAAVGLRSYLDILMGGHFWTSIVARYDKESGSDLTMRVPGPSDQPFTPLYRTATVHRVLGNLLEIEATPRWVVNDFMSLSAQYLYRRKPQDQYTGTPYTVSTDLTGGVPVTVDPATLGAGTALRERRMAWGVSFSNLHAVSQRRASIPIEVTYMHVQTLSGMGNNIPQQFSDQIQMRLYAQLFGR